jgi:DNA-binding transcriptional regulator PaaX
MSFKEELLWVMKDMGEFTTKMLTHRLSIAKMYYPTYYTTVRRLEQQGLVKKKKQGKTVTISLTPKGKQLLKKPAIGKRRTDGLSTIIIFDIPEEKKRAREGLRRYLIRQGYTLLQESVLIAPTLVTSELKEVIAELKIRQHVTIISGRIDYL